MIHKITDGSILILVKIVNIIGMFYHCKHWEKSYIDSVSTDINKLIDKDKMQNFLNDLNITIDNLFWEKWEILKNKKINRKLKRKNALDIDKLFIEKLEISTRKIMGVENYEACEY